MSSLKLSSDQFTGDSKVKVSVDVKNTEKRSGQETVELYSRDHFASVTPSVKRLRAFRKIESREKQRLSNLKFPQVIWLL
ncbi:MAG: hypothetical protein NVV82_25475 [Sporocytophaga sp.]|nr:hypothetical protein [Sporocytophaga sp.]